MKKILITASVIAFTAIANAASVNWGGAVANPTDTNIPLASGSSAYLLWSASTYESAATTISALTTGSIADNGGKIVDSYNLVSDDTNVNYAFTKNYAASNPANEIGYYAVLVVDGSDTSKAAYYYLGNVVSSTATSEPANLIINLDWSGSEYLTKGGYTVAVGAVPEPTSGLLMLVGIAGLALRRRRA